MCSIALWQRRVSFRYSKQFCVSPIPKWIISFRENVNHQVPLRKRWRKTHFQLQPERSSRDSTARNLPKHAKFSMNWEMKILESQNCECIFFASWFESAYFLDHSHSFRKPYLKFNSTRIIVVPVRKVLIFSHSLTENRNLIYNKQ